MQRIEFDVDYGININQRDIKKQIEANGKTIKKMIENGEPIEVGLNLHNVLDAKGNPIDQVTLKKITEKYEKGINAAFQAMIKDLKGELGSQLSEALTESLTESLSDALTRNIKGMFDDFSKAFVAEINQMRTDVIKGINDNAQINASDLLQVNTSSLKKDTNDIVKQITESGKKIDKAQEAVNDKINKRSNNTSNKNDGASNSTTNKHRQNHEVINELNKAIKELEEAQNDKISIEKQLESIQKNEIKVNNGSGKRGANKTYTSEIINDLKSDAKKEKAAIIELLTIYQDNEDALIDVENAIDSYDLEGISKQDKKYKDAEKKLKELETNMQNISNVIFMIGKTQDEIRKVAGKDHQVALMSIFGDDDSYQAPDNSKLEKQLRASLSATEKVIADRQSKIEKINKTKQGKVINLKEDEVEFTSGANARARISVYPVLNREGFIKDVVDAIEGVKETLDPIKVKFMPDEDSIYTVAADTKVDIETAIDDLGGINLSLNKDYIKNQILEATNGVDIELNGTISNATINNATLNSNQLTNSQLLLSDSDDDTELQELLSKFQSSTNDDINTIENSVENLLDAKDIATDDILSKVQAQIGDDFNNLDLSEIFDTENIQSDITELSENIERHATTSVDNVVNGVKTQIEKKKKDINTIIKELVGDLSLDENSGDTKLKSLYQLEQMYQYADAFKLNERYKKKPVGEERRLTEEFSSYKPEYKNKAKTIVDTVYANEDRAILKNELQILDKIYNMSKRVSEEKATQKACNDIINTQQEKLNKLKNQEAEATDQELIALRDKKKSCENIIAIQKGNITKSEKNVSELIDNINNIKQNTSFQSVDNAELFIASLENRRRYLESERMIVEDMRHEYYSMIPTLTKINELENNKAVNQEKIFHLERLENERKKGHLQVSDEKIYQELKSKEDGYRSSIESTNMLLEEQYNILRSEASELDYFSDKNGDAIYSLFKGVESLKPGKDDTGAKIKPKYTVSNLKKTAQEDINKYLVNQGSMAFKKYYESYEKSLDNSKLTKLLDDAKDLKDIYVELDQQISDRHGSEDALTKVKEYNQRQLDKVKKEKLIVKAQLNSLQDKLNSGNIGKAEFDSRSNALIKRQDELKQSEKLYNKKIKILSKSTAEQIKIDKAESEAIYEKLKTDLSNEETRVEKLNELRHRDIKNYREYNNAKNEIKEKRVSLGIFNEEINSTAEKMQVDGVDEKQIKKTKVKEALGSQTGAYYSIRNRINEMNSQIENATNDFEIILALTNEIAEKQKAIKAGDVSEKNNLYILVQQLKEVLQISGLSSVDVNSYRLYKQKYGQSKNESENNGEIDVKRFHDDSPTKYVGNIDAEIERLEKENIGYKNEINRINESLQKRKDSIASKYKNTKEAQQNRINYHQKEIDKLTTALESNDEMHDDKMIKSELSKHKKAIKKIEDNIKMMDENPDSQQKEHDLFIESRFQKNPIVQNDIIVRNRKQREIENNNIRIEKLKEARNKQDILRQQLEPTISDVMNAQRRSDEEIEVLNRSFEKDKKASEKKVRQINSKIKEAKADYETTRSELEPLIQKNKELIEKKKELLEQLDKQVTDEEAAIKIQNDKRKLPDKSPYDKSDLYQRFEKDRERSTEKNRINSIIYNYKVEMDEIEARRKQEVIDLRDDLQELAVLSTQYGHKDQSKRAELIQKSKNQSLSDAEETLLHELNEKNARLDNLIEKFSNKGYITKKNAISQNGVKYNDFTYHIGNINNAVKQTKNKVDNFSMTDFIAENDISGFNELSQTNDKFKEFASVAKEVYSIQAKIKKSEIAPESMITSLNQYLDRFKSLSSELGFDIGEMEKRSITIGKNFTIIATSTKDIESQLKGINNADLLDPSDIEVFLQLYKENDLLQNKVTRSTQPKLIDIEQIESNVTNLHEMANKIGIDLKDGIGKGFVQGTIDTINTINHPLSNILDKAKEIQNEFEHIKPIKEDIDKYTNILPNAIQEKTLLLNNSSYDSVDNIEKKYIDLFAKEFSNAKQLYQNKYEIVDETLKDNVTDFVQQLSIEDRDNLANMMKYVQEMKSVGKDSSYLKSVFNMLGINDSDDVTKFDHMNAAMREAYNFNIKEYESNIANAVSSSINDSKLVSQTKTERSSVSTEIRELVRVNEENQKIIDSKRSLIEQLENERTIELDNRKLRKQTLAENVAASQQEVENVKERVSLYQEENKIQNKPPENIIDDKERIIEVLTVAKQFGTIPEEYKNTFVELGISTDATRQKLGEIYKAFMANNLPLEETVQKMLELKTIIEETTKQNNVQEARVLQQTADVVVSAEKEKQEAKKETIALDKEQIRQAQNVRNAAIQSFRSLERTAKGNISEAGDDNKNRLRNLSSTLINYSKRVDHPFEKPDFKKVLDADLSNQDVKLLTKYYDEAVTEAQKLITLQNEMNQNSKEIPLTDSINVSELTSKEKEILTQIEATTTSIKEQNVVAETRSNDISTLIDNIDTATSVTALVNEKESLNDVAISAEQAAKFKRAFVEANKELRASVESSLPSIQDERNELVEVGNAAEESVKKTYSLSQINSNIKNAAKDKTRKKWQNVATSQGYVIQDDGFARQLSDEEKKAQTQVEATTESLQEQISTALNTAKINIAEGSIVNIDGNVRLDEGQPTSLINEFEKVEVVSVRLLDIVNQIYTTISAGSNGAINTINNIETPLSDIIGQMEHVEELINTVTVKAPKIGENIKNVIGGNVNVQEYRDINDAVGLMQEALNSGVKDDSGKVLYNLSNLKQNSDIKARYYTKIEQSDDDDDEPIAKKYVDLTTTFKDLNGEIVKVKYTYDVASETLNQSGDVVAKVTSAFTEQEKAIKKIDAGLTYYTSKFDKLKIQYATYKLNDFVLDNGELKAKTNDAEKILQIVPESTKKMIAQVIQDLDAVGTKFNEIKNKKDQGLFTPESFEKEIAEFNKMTEQFNADMNAVNRNVNTSIEHTSRNMIQGWQRDFTNMKAWLYDGSGDIRLDTSGLNANGLKYIEEYKKELAILMKMYKDYHNQGKYFTDDQVQRWKYQMQTLTDLKKQITGNGAKEFVSGKGFSLKESVSEDTFKEMTVNANYARDILKQFATEVAGTDVEVVKLSDDNHTLTYSFVDQNKNIQTCKLSIADFGKTIRNTTVDSTGHVGLLSRAFTSLREKLGQIFKYMSAYTIFYKVVNAIRSGVEIVKELDTAMMEMKKVSNDSSEDLEKFAKNSHKIAQEIGSTAAVIQNSAADWMRLGYSIKEAEGLAKNTSILMNVSEFDDISSATQSMVAMLQAFKDNGTDVVELSEQLIDKLNNIGNNYSISTSELAESLQRSSGTLIAAQNSVDEAIALTTAGNAIIQDAESTGNALKVISMRIRGTSAKELEDEGEDTEGLIETTSKLEEKVKSLTAVNGKMGISLLDANGNYRSTYEILQDIANVWEEIGKADVSDGQNRQAALLEILAGKTRAQALASILQNGEMLRDVYNDVQNSEGSAAKENKEYMESIEAHTEVLKAKWQELWDDSLQRKHINLIIDGLGKIVDLVDKIGVFPSVIGAGFGILKLSNFINGKTSGGRGKQFPLLFTNRIEINMPPNRLAERCTSYSLMCIR